ncbi:MAG: ABC transporter substrate-binding protein [Candidatus Hydrogenedentota bacterium]|nr:MAG: ABC transporter substrate-binding protein [Candidatus Hydrogenedentota bacterium]
MEIKKESCEREANPPPREREPFAPKNIFFADGRFGGTRSEIRWLVCAFLILVSTVSCGSGLGVPKGSGREEISIAVSSNPRSLDPAFATGVTEGEITAKIFNGLVRFQGAGVVADLAETWSVTPDGRTWRFRLRRGVRFHDGRGFSARDVAYSFERILDPALHSPRRWVLEKIKSIETPDSGTVILHLSSASASFLSLLAMPAAYIVPAGTGGKSSGFGRHPIGTGPYRFREWEDDRHVLLERNPDYFGGAARAKHVRFLVIPEPLTALALFRRGALDLTPVPSPQWPRLLSNPPPGRLLTADQLVTYYVAINTERFPDSRVRRAMNLAVDRNLIIEKILAGLGTSASGPVPPALLPRPLDPIPYDPVRAEELLDEAEFDRARRIVLLRSSNRAALEPATVIAGYLRDIGLNVKVEPMEFASLRARVNNADFDLCLFNWYADYPDAENFLVPLFHSRNVGSAGNRARFRDARTDRLLDRIERLPAGRKRDEAVLAAVARIRQEAPWIFLWYPRQALAVSSKLDRYTAPVIFNGDKGLEY